MPQKRKFRYSLDDLNRLLVRNDNQEYPVEGEFKIERNNLIFESSRKSHFTKELDLPKRIKFLGHWHLTQNRDLKLSLVENDYQNRGDELEIKGKLIAAESDTLVFETKCKKTATQDKLLLLRLGGRWQANEYNELNFIVSKDIEEDVLRFKGAWSINQNQEIVYVYEKHDLLHKTTTSDSIAFKGFWQITTTDRILYSLDLENKSFFDFKVQLEEREFKEAVGEIKFRIGMGIKDLKEERVFSLLGRWLIEGKRNIYFEIDYGQRGLRAIIFGATVYLNKNNQFIFELKDRKGEDLGLRLTFKRDFLKRKAEVFARLSKMEGENRWEAGFRIPW